MHNMGFASGGLKCKTQQQLADKVDKLDRAKISDIENGKEDFHFSTLLKIFDALDLEVEINVKRKKMK